VPSELFWNKRAILKLRREGLLKALLSEQAAGL